MDEGEYEAAAKALIHWFTSQEIGIEDAVPIMLIAIRAAIDAAEADKQEILGLIVKAIR